MHHGLFMFLENSPYQRFTTTGLEIIPVSVRNWMLYIPFGKFDTSISYVDVAPSTSQSTTIPNVFTNCTERIPSIPEMVTDVDDGLGEIVIPLIGG